MKVKDLGDSTPKFGDIDNPYNIIDFCENINSHFNNNTNKFSIIKSYQQFLNIGADYTNYSELKAQVTEKIKKCPNRTKLKCISNFFSIFVHNLLSQQIISSNLKEKLKNVYNAQNKTIYEVKDIGDIGDSNASFKLVFDENAHFYFQKTYANDIYNRNRQIIDDEVHIYHTDFSSDRYHSFIVHSDKNVENNKILIPYFEFHDLEFFFQRFGEGNTKEKLSDIDKIVIIKEIAIGLSELHEHFIYHNNLNHKHIFVDNNKNAYIGTFAYSIELEPNATKQEVSSYYRHPDLIQNPNELSIETEVKEDKARYDIYSFGVLAHEIITTKSPKERFGNMTRKDRIDQLQSNYFDFLFKEEDDFDDKYGVPGMREIISRSMSRDEKTQYSTFKEVISSIDDLRIYKDNEYEIETRIHESKDCNTYECGLSDIVINFYFGNETSKNIISKFINKCQEVGINKTAKITSEDPLTKILQLFNFVSLRQRIIQAPSDFNDPSVYIEDFHKLFERIKKYTDIHPLISAYQSFLKEDKEEIYSKLKTKVINEIKTKPQDKQYQLIYQLFSQIINHLFDQQKIIDKLKNILSDSDPNCENVIDKNFEESEYNDLNDLQNIGDFNSAFKSCFDSDCKFYFKKTFNSNNNTTNVSQELIDHEIEIYEKEFKTDKYGSFIVHSTMNEIGSNQILIPYFPFMNLRVFLSNINDKYIFTTIDKVVIIKEIAIGFSELHSDHIYHQNINSSDIFIDNNKNAYIGNFAHDNEYEQHQTKLVQSAYYRHPDLIQKPNELSIETEDKEDKARYDIYSFGVLAHEIITRKSPNDRFGNTSREKRINQLQSNYFDFLFKEEDDFDDKYGVPGMRDIISRCMSRDEKTQYSTFKEVISSIDNLRIYKDNEYEIETRISESKDCNTYECGLSDIVINFYFGNETSKNTISKFIKVCQKLGINEKIEISPIEEDVITPILQFFYFKKDGYGIKNLRQLLNLAQSHSINPSKFMSLFENSFEELNKYTDRGPLIAAYKSFLRDDKEDNHSELKRRVTNEISKFQRDEQYQKIHQLFSLIIHNLIDQTKIQLKFQENQTDENCLQKSLNGKQFHDLTDIQNIGDFNAAFKSCFDEDCKFYFKKSYTSNNLTSNVSQELIDHEIEIYKKEFRTDKYGSFIVHSTNKIGNNHILIPYFPFMNLRVFLSNINDNKDEMRIEFTTIDKLVMIKEIAIGFSELHSNHIYHQNINSSDIFIDNNKNAYIGNFAHDTKLEQQQTKLIQSAYYRHPDLILNPNELSIESENDEYKARYDIYSFGVLLNEIITTKSPNDRFGNETRQNRINQLTGSFYCFCDFLFHEEEKGGENFDDKYGVPGMRDIISRCMSRDEETQCSTFKEVISSIDDLTIYKNNKEEIETRIHESKDCNPYECELSDIVTNFYYGNKASKNTISKFIKVCQKLGINENIEISPIEEDVITPILQFFDFKNRETNYTNEMLFFKERFNKMIELNSTEKNSVCNECLSDNEKQLMKMSMIENNKLSKSKNKSNKDDEFYDCGEVIMKFNSNIIPITNVEEFEKEASGYICEHLLIYLFFISKELSNIHSRNLYHGEISTKSIGIYYNNETETFLPLIIPFYFFFKNSPNTTTTSTTSLTSASMTQNKISDIDKYQRKDVKRFKEMMRYFDKNEIIPPEIYEIETMNAILYEICNLNIHNQNDEIKNKFDKNYENFSHKEYSSFEITLPTIHDIFVFKEETNEIYQIFDRYLRIDATVSYILRFSNFIISEYIENETPEDASNIIEIKEKLIKIDENNEQMFDEIARIEDEEKHTDYSYEFREDSKKGIGFTVKKKTSHDITENSKEGNNPVFLQEDYSQSKKLESANRVGRIDNKLVYRTLEIATNIKIYSFRFIITRYIFGLNPLCKYRINVKIQQSKDKNIVTVSHRDAMNFISRLGFYPEQNSNNDIIFFVSLNYRPVKPPEKQDKQDKEHKQSKQDK